MARKLTGNPSGPVPMKLDFEKFEMLCGLYCTTDEIAANFKIHPQTLRIRVSEHYGEEYPLIYKRFFDAGTPSLRRDRRVLAKKNAAMSIWLGKVHLGEKEEAPEIKVDPIALQQFNAIMGQLTQFQERKMADNSIKTDANSH